MAMDNLVRAVFPEKAEKSGHKNRRRGGIRDNKNFGAQGPGLLVKEARFPDEEIYLDLLTVQVTQNLHEPGFQTSGAHLPQYVQDLHRLGVG